MPIDLPPSLRAENDPSREKAAAYADMTPEQRFLVLASVCRDAVALLALHEDPRRALSWQAPLPESTVRALARLRRLPRG